MLLFVPSASMLCGHASAPKAVQWHAACCAEPFKTVMCGRADWGRQQSDQTVNQCGVASGIFNGGVLVPA
jgi:hypothetical protein